MRTSRFVILGFAFALALGFNACNEDDENNPCSGIPGSVLYELGAPNLPWLPDSVNSMILQNGNGTLDTLVPAGSYMYGTRTIDETACQNEEARYVYNNLTSSAGTALHWEIMAGPTGHLRIALANDTTQVNFHDTIPFAFSNPTGCELSSNSTYLDSAEVNGAWYYKLYRFHFDSDTCMSLVEPDSIYWAQDYGLIRWVQQDGTVWEALP